MVVAWESRQRWQEVLNDAPRLTLGMSGVVVAAGGVKGLCHRRRYEGIHYV